MSRAQLFVDFRTPSQDNLKRTTRGGTGTLAGLTQASAFIGFIRELQNGRALPNLCPDLPLIRPRNAIAIEVDGAAIEVDGAAIEVDGAAIEVDGAIIAVPPHRGPARVAVHRDASSTSLEFERRLPFPSTAAYDDELSIVVVTSVLVLVVMAFWLLLLV
ncbi:hypothetical protein B0H67DRAFT_645681 [Lasiosphaeris hirsuta]|uniref:Uncharacterized protein n=1 Tax=Lasiosphaeris hirsuta TaxID=260670 RepID=A0AA40AHL4_9PEZI|nr:hypothetical protein B0H67DRAFT_645681 [Lasiosphaeris hirsuta]